MTRRNCHYCNRHLIAAMEARFSPDTETVDHYRPKSIRGHLDPEETVVSCRRCNGMKGSTPPEVFKRYIEIFGHAGLNNGRAYRLFCYRLMIAGLQSERIEQDMRDEFPWMLA